jgi:hypothetical protein
MIIMIGYFYFATNKNTGTRSRQEYTPLHRMREREGKSNGVITNAEHAATHDMQMRTRSSGPDLESHFSQPNCSHLQAFVMH